MKAAIYDHQIALQDIFYGVDAQLASISLEIVWLPLARCRHLADSRPFTQRAASAAVEDHVQKVKQMQAEGSTAFQHIKQLRSVAEESSELAIVQHAQLERFFQEQRGRIAELGNATQALQNSVIFSSLAMLSQRGFPMLFSLPEYYRYCEAFHLCVPCPSFR